MPEVVSLPWLDGAIIVAYMLLTMVLGCWFYLRSRSPEGFTRANGELPSVVVGLSIFGTYVSSISFLALPGKAFASNWNVFGLSLTIPLAAWIATKWFVPFYRKIGVVSAYAHLEVRFGAWARVYASLCYLLTQVARMGSVLFLLALPLHHLLGWDVRMIILMVGGISAFYSMLGGIAGVIWTDAVQSVILILGAVASAALLVLQMPQGPGQLLQIASEANKFSWGSFDCTDFTHSTFWVVFLYGMVINLQNFGIDQNYIQRYLTARTEAEAKKSVWLGALLYLPISAFFLFIGTALYTFYVASPGWIADPALLADIAAGKGDGVFPYFIVHQLPTGMTGLLIAAILAAAMSTISTSMNGCATLTLTDFYKRFFRPQASSREQMAVLYASSLLWGMLGMACALQMLHAKGILDAYWMLAGIFSGGMVGLFLLGFLSPRASSRAAIAGVALGVCCITWMTLSMPQWGIWPQRWEGCRCTWNDLMIPVCGTVVILLVGFAVSGMRKKSNPKLL